MSKELQQLYDESRECDTEIQAGKEALRRKKEIEIELKKLEIDLVKEKKITWTRVPFEEWFNEDETENEYWIYITDCGTDMGIFKGLSDLTNAEFKHFEDYRNDYFYYGGPNYIDRNAPRAELTECELAFEADCRVICMEKNQL